jgi:hypothetical protein
VALLERLQILIDADAQGAIREFDKVGKEAAKASKKTEDKFKKLSGTLTNVGGGAVLGGVAVLGGLGKLAMMSEEAEKQTLKLNNSIKNSSQSFKGNGKALKDLANDLQQVTASDADALVGAESLLVSFGLTEDQIKKLLPLVNDFSRKFGVDLEASAKVVGKALNGSAGGLKKYGIDLDKTKLSADAFGTVIEGLGNSVGGFAKAEGKTFSGQLEILKNNLGDLGETVGKGAASVFSDLAGGAISLIGGLNNLNPALGESVGKVGAIASLSVGAVGGLTFVVGQFAKVKEAAINASGGFTKFGKAAIGLGIAASVFAAYQIADAIDSAVLSTERYKKAARTLADAKGPVETVKALKDLEEQSDSAADKFLRLGDYLGVGVRQANKATIEIQGVEFTVSKLKGALSDLVEAGDAQALAAALKIIETGATGSKNSLDLVNGTVEQYKKKLKDLTGGQALATIAQRDLSDQVGAAVDAYDQQEVTFEGLNKSLKTVESNIKLLSAAYELADANAAGFGKSIEQSTRLDDAVGAVNSLRTGLKDLDKGLKGIPKSFEAALNPFAKVDEQGQEALGNLLSFGQNAIGYLQSLIQQGAGSIVPGVAGKLREQLITALKKAGIKDPKEIEKYLGLAGLATFQIDAALRVGNVEAELAKVRTTLALFENELKAAPKEIRVAINQAILRNDFVVANRLLDFAARPRSARIGVDIILPNQGILGALIPGFVFPTTYGRPRRAKGGPVTKSMPYMVNERGPEMFVPSSNGFVMNNSDSKRLVAGVEQMVSGGVGNGSVVYNVNVSSGINDPAETGRRVVDAIRSYERTNGTGWRN